MKNIGVAAKVITKILEVGHWVAVGLMSLAGILSLIKPEWLKYVMSVDSIKGGGELSAYGFEVMAANSDGKINYITLFLFSVGATAIFVVMALLFRNLHLIIKKSEKTTPFSSENIRRLKNIGRFSILVPVIGFLMSIVIRIASGVDSTEIAIDQSGIIMGCIVFCLTEYFVHGAELEKEVEGLV